MSDLKSVLEEQDIIKYELLLTSLSEDTVKRISSDQNEPEWMLKFRLNALKIFNSMPLPTRWPDLSRLDFSKIVYYARPKKEFEWNVNDWNRVDPVVKKKFERLGIPEAEVKYLAGAWWQMDSKNVYHKLKEKREQRWVVFEDMTNALQKYPELVQKYFMKLVGPTTHKFAALHGAVWSGWTFIYIPKWLEVNEPLQAYFRMNTYWWWQFEHTLIVIDDDAKADYIEWCSAPKFDQYSLHAWLVEIFVGKNSRMRYSSVENRSTNTFNLNTKRAVVEENWYMERVSWNLGSCVAMLYPCSVLKWNNSKSEFFGVAVASQDQNQDIWYKALHIWQNTSSRIVSKSISKDWWISTYRWIVDIKASALNSINSTQCDALLLDELSVSSTIPDIHVENDSSIVSHEASAGKIDESELFYLTSRWLEQERATAMIVNWFFSSIVKKLPLEYAWELNKLVDMEMDHGF